MKKTTFILIFFVCSIMSAQTSILNFDTDTNVANQFAFDATNAPISVVANPDMTTPAGNGTTTPGPNTSAMCLENVTGMSVGGFGNGFRTIFTNEINLNTEVFISLYIRSTGNNFNTRLQFQDNPGDGAACASTLNQNPTEADVVYTGAGDWQLVEGQAVSASMDFTCPGGGVDRGTGDKLYQQMTIFIDTGDAVTTAFTTQLDEISQSATANPLLSAEEFKRTEVGIFPNPVTTPALNIKGDITSNTAQIYDLSGRLVATKNITGNFNSVDVSALTNGVYFLKLENGVSLKFLKK